MALETLLHWEGASNVSSLRRFRLVIRKLNNYLFVDLRCYTQLLLLLNISDIINREVTMQQHNAHSKNTTQSHSQMFVKKKYELVFLKYGSEISYCVSLKRENLKRCESLHSQYQIQSSYHLRATESQARWIWVCSINVRTHTKSHKKQKKKKAVFRLERTGGDQGCRGKWLRLTFL